MRGARLWPIARREYVERVRSRTFLIGTFLAPLLLAGFTIGPHLLMAHQRDRPLQIAILDLSGALRGEIEPALRTSGERFEARYLGPEAGSEATRRLSADVLAGRLDGYLVLPADVLRSSTAEYHGPHVGNVSEIQGLLDAVEQRLVDRRLAAAGIDPAKVRGLTRRLSLRTLRVSAAGEREDRGATLILATLLLVLLYTSTLLWGQSLMQGVIEEKNNRVVEIAVSSVSPGTLLAGKLLGVGAAGLTQFLVWVTSLALLGVYGAGALATTIPHLPEVPPSLLAYMVLFFLLGYFLFGSLLVAVGAAVNSQQEAQSLSLPAMSPLILSVMFFPAVLQRPDGALAVAVSLIPLTAPLMMFLRITVLPPPALQIALSVALQLATIAAVVWAAGRIYRVGILMYGKRPTLFEILKWVRR